MSKKNRGFAAISACDVCSRALGATKAEAAVSAAPVTATAESLDMAGMAKTRVALCRTKSSLGQNGFGQRKDCWADPSIKDHKRTSACTATHRRNQNGACHISSELSSDLLTFRSSHIPWLNGNPH